MFQGQLWSTWSQAQWIQFAQDHLGRFSGLIILFLVRNLFDMLNVAITIMLSWLPNQHVNKYLIYIKAE